LDWCGVATCFEGFAEALLGSASEQDLLVRVAKDEAGFVAGFAMEMKRRLEVENGKRCAEHPVVF
jgi:hypothetical protein